MKLTVYTVEIHSYDNLLLNKVFTIPLYPVFTPETITTGIITSVFNFRSEEKPLNVTMYWFIIKWPHNQTK